MLLMSCIAHALRCDQSDAEGIPAEQIHEPQQMRVLAIRGAELRTAQDRCNGVVPGSAIQ